MAQKRRYGQKGGRGGASWTLPAVTIAIGIIIIVAVVKGLGPKSGVSVPSTPVTADVMKNLTGIPLATWNAVGAKNATPPTFVGYTPATGSASATASGTPSATGTAGAAATGPASASGKPVILYVGAEYCPYCAAERWSMVTALARFGTFQKLSYSHSAANDVYPNTPTFTFYGSTFSSPYIDLQAVETTTNVPSTTAPGYTSLQQPTQSQQLLYATYNSPPYFATNIAGHIPFLLIGKRYAWVGSQYDPQLLAGATQPKIAAGLPAGTSAAAQAILANANEITAAICAVDGGQPGNVCTSTGVQTAAKTLPTGPKS